MQRHLSVFVLLVHDMGTIYKTVYSFCAVSHFLCGSSIYLVSSHHSKLPKVTFQKATFQANRGSHFALFTIFAIFDISMCADMGNTSRGSHWDRKSLQQTDSLYLLYSLSLLILKC